jgi:hypothetical protein
LRSKENTNTLRSDNQMECVHRKPWKAAVPNRAKVLGASRAYAASSWGGPPESGLFSANRSMKGL